MLLSARILDNLSGVNGFDYAEQARFTEGDAPIIYLQLVDASRDRAESGFNPAGRRYIPAAGATLQVVFDNISDDRLITRTATQPFASDPSIWSVSVMPTDGLRGTVNLKLTLTEGLKITRGFISAAVAVESLTGVI